MSKNIIESSQIEEFVETIAQETYSLFKTSHTKSNNNFLYRKVALQFISKFIHIALMDILTEHRSKNYSSKKSYEYTYANFSSFKKDLQDAISSAFEESFIEFSNLFVEYYVRIEPVPNPINKQPC